MKNKNSSIKNKKKLPPPNDLKKKQSKNKITKRKLGMGLSSLLSKDQELASAIKNKIKEKVNSSPLKIQVPKLSNNETTNKLSMIGLKKESLGQKNIPIQQLVSGKFQPRKNFDQQELDELAQSIKTNGVLQPILVRSQNNNTYEIIAGERRWRASQLAKLHEVPVIVREFDDDTAIGVAMIENLQRSDLNLVEEAEGYRTMMNVFEYTQEKLSSQLGKSRSHIANVLRILSLPKNVKKHIISGEISFGHARALVTLNEEEANEISMNILDKGLSVRETEKLVNRHKKLNKTSQSWVDSPNPNNSKNTNVEHLERELTSLLGLRIVINHKSNNSGNLSIFYKSLDQIQPVIDKLKWRPK